jgi:hypothetical protein
MLNLPSKVEGANVLLCGMGGGFDIYGTLPIYYTLTRMGMNCFFHSHQFSHLVSSIVDENEHDSSSFLPEIPLAKFIKKPIYIDGRVGPSILRKSYEKIIEKHNIDHVIMVDCGVDSLMHGDEEFKGTVGEDFVALAAFKNIPIKKWLVVFGFGCEVEEQISHYHALENMAELIKDDAFLGSCSLTKNMSSFQFYKSAYENIANLPNYRKSHIHPRIIPSIEGLVGEKWYQNESSIYPEVLVFLSPLMGIMWFFDGDVVIKKNNIIPLLENHFTFAESISTIEEMSIPTRMSQSIPY